jgi:hypothetical protein
MSVSSDECGFVCYGVCTCDESDYGGKNCPYKSINACPVHNDDLLCGDDILTAKEKQEIVIDEVSMTSPHPLGCETCSDKKCPWRKEKDDYISKYGCVSWRG